MRTDRSRLRRPLYAVASDGASYRLIALPTAMREQAPTGEARPAPKLVEDRPTLASTSVRSSPSLPDERR